jgi:hypothetical protein
MPVENAVLGVGSGKQEPVEVMGVREGNSIVQHLGGIQEGSQLRTWNCHCLWQYNGAKRFRA